MQLLLLHLLLNDSVDRKEKAKRVFSLEKQVDRALSKLNLNILKEANRIILFSVDKFDASSVPRNANCRANN